MIAKTCTVVMLPATKTLRAEPDGNTYLTAIHLWTTHKRQELRCDRFHNGMEVPNAQHLYICSSDKITIGDWYYNPAKTAFGEPHVERCEYDHESKACLNEPVCLKIIASTDPALKLPGIPEQFLQEYCKAGGISETRVLYDTEWVGGSDYRRGGHLVEVVSIVHGNFISIVKPKPVVERTYTKTEVIDILIGFCKAGGKEPTSEQFRWMDETIK